MSNTIHVYILRCADGSYYVGTTEDLKGRENAHNDGRGAKYTFLRRPVQLVYSESYDSLEKAIERERQLKGWNRPKKKALIDGDAPAFRPWLKALRPPCSGVFPSDARPLDTPEGLRDDGYTMYY